MKITIESTELDGIYKTAASVSVGHDDVDGDKLATLLQQVCIGYGFHPDTVKDIFNEEC